MNGPDHYREAERILNKERYDRVYDRDDIPDLLLALTHAVLGLAAATALSGGSKFEEDRWKDAAGSKLTDRD